MSADFRRHSVSYFIAPLLEGHDPKAVEVFCYADVARPDAVTARLQAAVHHWRDVCGRSDNEVFDIIRTDSLDILVDLAGHTTGNRLGVFAGRAAPVQVTAIGYPATTGLPAMDFRLVDASTDPRPEADEWASEKLVRLPHLHCYAPLIDMPACGPLPALAAGHVTFGSFNKLAKVSAATLALWAGVLNAVPNSRMIIKAKALADLDTRVRLAKAFAAYGITHERIELRGWVPGNWGHLDLYNRIDIALDTTPYNGTTTTCEALWMGVPVLTLRGRGHAARVGASLLGQVGMTEWVALQADQFVPRAAQFAGDITMLAALRANLRDRMQASSLCDKQSYARAVEAAYRVMAQNAGASQQ